MRRKSKRSKSKRSKSKRSKSKQKQWFERYEFYRDEAVDLIEVEFMRRGMTQAQLAELAGLGVATVHDLLSRKTIWPRYSTVWRLLDVLGMKAVRFTDAPSGASGKRDVLGRTSSRRASLKKATRPRVRKATRR